MFGIVKDCPIRVTGPFLDELIIFGVRQRKGKCKRDDWKKRN